jgi:hypothetical protein
MTDRYSIALVRDGRHEPAEIELVEEASGRIRLILRGAGLKVEAESDDSFSALQDVRRVLEKDGLAAYCYGSSRNVYPSGMSRSMGDGRRAYRLSLGNQGRMADLVDIFTAGSDIQLATVREQEEFVQLWIDSLRKKSRQAEPGATDNPDDAQRLREDH